ncbi:IQ motif containing F3, isoform CRA_b [Mus musculus]|nr:IQ motif containing F3, isoform CRA_b [Mus musculus]
MGALFVKPKPKVHQQAKTTQPKSKTSLVSEDEDEIIQRKYTLKVTGQPLQVNC